MVGGGDDEERWWDFKARRRSERWRSLGLKDSDSAEGERSFGFGGRGWRNLRPPDGMSGRQEP